jgi:hypothetical protein
MKNYTKIEGTNYELKSCTYYHKGGMNYFTSRNEARGYYLSVTPVQVERRADGIIIESYSAFSGIKQLLIECKRKSNKTEEQAEQLAISKVFDLEEYVINQLKNKIK